MLSVGSEFACLHISYSYCSRTLKSWYQSHQEILTKFIISLFILCDFVTVVPNS